LFCAEADVGGEFFDFSALFSDTAKERSKERTSEAAGAAEETTKCAAEGAAGCGSTALAEQQREGTADYGVADDTAEAIGTSSTWGCGLWASAELRKRDGSFYREWSGSTPGCTRHFHRITLETA
jgi:hypothetical protein